jgi:MFS family permease
MAGIITKYDRTIWVLFLARLINSFGFTIVMPFLAIYLCNELGVAASLVGMLYAVSIGIGAISQFVGGELCDRFGRKKLLMYSVGLRGITYISMAVTISFFHASFPIIAALVIIGSMLGGLYRPTLDVLVADYVPPKDRMEVYGLQRIAGNLGFAMGPAVGGLAAAYISYTSLFVFTAFCNFATFALILLFIREPKMRRSEEKFRLSQVGGLVKDKPFFAHSLTSLLMLIVSSQLIVTLSIYTVDVVGISLVEMGMLFTINGLIVVFFQYWVSRLFSKANLTTTLAAGAAIYALGYLSVAFAPNFWFLVVSMVIISFGELMVMPTQATLVANLAPPESRGRYMGFFGLFSEMGHSIGPLMGGALMDASKSTPVMLWGLICVTGFCASAGYLVVGSLVRKKKLHKMRHGGVANPKSKPAKPF